MIVEGRAIGGEGLGDGRGDAIDMDMQLVLAARPFRVDRQPDGVARQGTVETRLEQRFGLPCVGEDIGRVRREHLRIFDSGDAPGRDGEHLGGADTVLEDRDALRFALPKIDAFARLWTFARLSVRQTGVVHNATKRHRVGGGAERDQHQTDRERESPKTRKSTLAHGTAWAISAELPRHRTGYVHYSMDSRRHSATQRRKAGTGREARASAFRSASLNRFRYLDG